MLTEERTESVGMLEPTAEVAAIPEDHSRIWAEEAAEFISRQVLERGANFFDG